LVVLAGAFVDIIMLLTRLVTEAIVVDALALVVLIVVLTCRHLTAAPPTSSVLAATRPEQPMCR